jgi:hypothetical protein
VVDGQIVVPATATERLSIQAVVSLTANSAARPEIPAGKQVKFLATIELPPNTAQMLSAEWDFEGTGAFADSAKFNAGSRVSVYFALVTPTLGQVALPAFARLSDEVVQKRANDLLSQMTPEEKMGQLSQIFVIRPFGFTREKTEGSALGSVLFLTEPAKINAIQQMAVEESRLHIPLYLGLDVIFGFRTAFRVR